MKLSLMKAVGLSLSQRLSSTFTVAQSANWGQSLSGVHGEMISAALLTNNIDGEALYELGDSQLREIGLAVGPRAVLLKGIKNLKIQFPPPTRKTFILRTFALNCDYEVEATDICTCLDNDEQLQKLIKDHGGGSLMKRGSNNRAGQLADIESGNIYVLTGGRYAAIHDEMSWTQVSDSVLETEAVLALLRALKNEDWKEFIHFNGGTDKGKVLITKDGMKMEIDGLCVSGTTAVLVEAKHHAQEHHIDIIKRKVEHVERVIKEGGVEGLQGITKIIPVLASNQFSRSMVRLCKETGISVVKPNGTRLSLELCSPDILITSMPPM